MYYRLFVSFEWERATAVVRKCSTRDLDQITVFCCTPHGTHNFGIMLGTDCQSQSAADFDFLSSLCCAFPFKNFIYFFKLFWERPRWRRRRYSRQQCCWWNLSLYLFFSSCCSLKEDGKIYVEIIILKNKKKNCVIGEKNKAVEFLNMRNWWSLMNPQKEFFHQVWIE